MKLFHVNDKKTEKKFINVALNIYSNEKYWIQPLDKDINSVFNNKENKTFRHNKVSRWILVSENRLIGRIAAFYNNKSSKNNKLLSGGCGFFECLNDQNAANLLFN